jgi:hypothetical protein
MHTTAMTGPRRSRLATRLLAPLALGAALVAGACVPPTTTPSTTAPPVTTPPTANQLAIDDAADWLLTQFDAAGYLPNTWDPSFPDLGNQVLAVANLAALDKGNATAAARIGHLATHMEDYVDEGAGDRPGALARVIMAAVAAGEDPRDFGGSDLVARLEATIQPNGLFGSQYPNFDGAFRQGLALAALSIVTPRPASITPGPGQTIDDLPVVSWLQDQQCDDGSWLMYRATTPGPCIENPAMWTFKDSNGSALAILGLEAVGADADVDPLIWLTAVRGDDGGWGTSPAGPSTESDANSTGLVLAAIEATGATPDAAAYAALRNLQLGASAPAADRGGFQWMLSVPGPNRLATLDAMTALFDEVWPAALLGD